MRTVTFYSYKGGVGRTLTLANVARYLSQFGLKVFALDLDLEAPGLHYKLLPHRRDEIKHGFVDYLHAVLSGSPVDVDLRAFVLSVEESNTSGGRIDLMPAGRVPSSEYWQRLAQLSWHELFYSDHATGVPFFLDLKERIAKEYQPDFLLIDARTGITEIGGVATTILPDQLVCILINNEENLEGARAVLRSLKGAPRLPGDKPVEVIPVVARIPEELKREAEQSLLDSIKAFLEQPSEDLSASLTVEEVFVLHSESALQLREYLKFGNSQVDDTPLLRDYLRLFQRLINVDVIRAQLAPILQKLQEKVLDEPDVVQRELEALANIAPHIEVFRALLKFYRLRNVDSPLILKIAQRLWESGGLLDPLVLEVVSARFKELPKYEQVPINLAFIESVWEADGGRDRRLGIALANTLASRSKDADRRASKIFSQILGSDSPANPQFDKQAIVGLVRVGDWKAALTHLAKPAFLDAMSPADLESITDVIVELPQSKDPSILFLQIIGARWKDVRQQDMMSWVKLLFEAGREEEARAEAEVLLQETVKAGPSGTSMRFGRVFARLGLLPRFEELAREQWPRGTDTEGFLREIRRRA